MTTRPNRHSAAWRVVRSDVAPAAENMAVDEAIMLAVARGEAPATLRVYEWRPPAVSVGRFQEFEGHVDLQACRERGYDVVRRPTGGRAILHDDEVTYSVCVLQDALAHGQSVRRSYRELSRGIERGLARLGLAAELAERRGAQDLPRSGLPTACFAHASRGDMVAAGRKIVGSAQTRRRGAILQHGSVPLRLDLPALAAVLRDSAPESEHTSLRDGAGGVAEALGVSPTRAQLAEALIAGFREAFPAEWTEGELTRAERQDAERLTREKYATEKWTFALPGGPSGATAAEADA